MEKIMEKTSLIDEFTRHHEIDRDLKSLEKKSRIYKSKEKQWHKKWQTLKKAQDSLDIFKLLTLEAFILNDDLTKEDGTRELKSTATKALEQFNEAMLNLNTLKSGQYKHIDTSYSKKTRDSNNLPRDACRQFIRSQITRLSNKLTNNLSDGETNFLNARRENMYCAERLYKQMQQEALEEVKG